jgi:hypothetical protein
LSITPCRHPGAVLRLRQVVARRQEGLGPQDPAALAAVAPARVFAAGGADVAKTVVIVAPGDAIGIGQVRGRCVKRHLCRPDGLRPDLAVGVAGIAHLGQQPLQDLHRIGPGVDIHVKDRRLQRLGQAADAGAGEVMLDVDLDRLRAGQRPHVGDVDPRVAVHVDPQAPQGADGHPVVRRPARIVGVVHKAALTGDDFFGNVLD